MRDINRVTLVGRLAAAPEEKQIDSERSRVRYRVATNYYWKQQGEWNTGVDFHNVVMWRGAKKNGKKPLKKGDAVLVDGKMRTRSWEAEGGEKRWSTEVIARQVDRVDAPIRKQAPDTSGESVSTDTELDSAVVEEVHA